MARILVIDDDLHMRIVLRRMLEYAGHEALEASDGAEGMRVFEESEPELVITDILMPNREGLETIMGLRRHDPRVRIIAMSGGGRDGSMNFLNAADKLGAAYSIEKPFTCEQMLEAVSETLAA